MPTENDLWSKPWDTKKTPDVKGLKALVLPGAFYSACVGLMAEAGFEKANTVEEADVVVFIGGEDVNPALYGDKPLICTYWDNDRDISEEWYFHKARKLNKPMFGICRGAQFLHVMNGGELWQDVQGHAGPDHEILDVEENRTVMATSLHHQMLKPNPRMTLIAIPTEQVSKSFQDGDCKLTLVDDATEIEPEAGCYEDTGCFFVQGHPEIGCDEYRSWCMTKLEDFIYSWEIVKDSPELLSSAQRN